MSNVMCEHTVTTEGAIASFMEAIFLTIVAAVLLYCCIYLIQNPIEGPTSTSISHPLSVSVCLFASLSLSLSLSLKAGGGKRVSAV